MNAANHLAIGKLVWEYSSRNKALLLRRGAFLVGNLLPDFTFSNLIVPHTAEYYLEKTQGKIQRLLHGTLGKTSAGFGQFLFSLRLGIVCHFYADFFCFAHNGYVKNLWQHILHESRLSRFARQRLQLLQHIDLLPEGLYAPEQLTARLEEMRAFYLGRPHNYGTELYGTLQACCLLFETTLAKRDFAYENRILDGYFSPANQWGNQHLPSA